MKSSNHWKFFAALVPIIGTFSGCSPCFAQPLNRIVQTNHVAQVARGPGAPISFFQAATLDVEVQVPGGGLPQDAAAVFEVWRTPGQWAMAVSNAVISSNAVTFRAGVADTSIDAGTYRYTVRLFAAATNGVDIAVLAHGQANVLATPYGAVAGNPPTNGITINIGTGGDTDVLSNIVWQTFAKIEDLPTPFDPSALESNINAVAASIPDVSGYATTDQLSNYLPLTGGTMDGNVNWGEHSIENVGAILGFYGTGLGIDFETGQFYGGAWEFPSHLATTDQVAAVEAQLPTSGSVSNWDAAYSWGNHADAGYMATIPDRSIAAVKLATQNLHTVYSGWGDGTHNLSVGPAFVHPFGPAHGALYMNWYWNTSKLYLFSGPQAYSPSAPRIFTTLDMGAGSGLDADTLQGSLPSDFARANSMGDWTVMPIASLVQTDSNRWEYGGWTVVGNITNGVISLTDTNNHYIQTPAFPAGVSEIGGTYINANGATALAVDHYRLMGGWVSNYISDRPIYRDYMGISAALAGHQNTLVQPAIRLRYDGWIVPPAGETLGGLYLTNLAIRGWTQSAYVGQTNDAAGLIALVDDNITEDARAAVNQRTLDSTRSQLQNAIDGIDPSLVGVDLNYNTLRFNHLWRARQTNETLEFCFDGAPMFELTGGGTVTPQVVGMSINAGTVSVVVASATAWRPWLEYTTNLWSGWELADTNLYTSTWPNLALGTYTISYTNIYPLAYYRIRSTSTNAVAGEARFTLPLTGDASQITALPSWVATTSQIAAVEALIPDISNLANTDQVAAVAAQLPSSGSVSNWDAAYAWGNHAAAGYVTNSPAWVTFLRDVSLVNFAAGGKSNFDIWSRVSPPQGMTNIVRVFWHCVVPTNGIGAGAGTNLTLALQPYNWGGGAVGTVVPVYTLTTNDRFNTAGGAEYYLVNAPVSISLPAPTTAIPQYGLVFTNGPTHTFSGTIYNMFQVEVRP